MKRRHLLMLIMVLVLVVASIFVMASCADTNKDNTDSSGVHEHTYGEWEIIIIPTKTNKGVVAKECKECHEAQTFILPMIDDSGYIKQTLTEPTCQAAGKDKYTYNLNGSEISFEVEVTKIEHKQKANANYCEFCGQVLDNSVFTFELNKENTYNLVKATNVFNDVAIPEIYNNKAVTSIGENAFKDCTGLTGITIPESVKSVGSNAFSGCNALNKLNITDISSWCNISFSDIGANPLYYAHNLYLNDELVTNLEIPSSVTSIGRYAFYGCSSLTSITIPEGVTSIGWNAFYYCSSLKSITIPSSVTSIDYQAFSGCSSLTSVTIPESVTSIGSDVFDGCSSLTIYAEAISEPEGWAKNTSDYNNNSWNPDNRPVVWDCKNNDVATDGYKYTVDNGIRYALKYWEATVVRQPENIDENITIPSSITYKGRLYSVTGIVDYAFRDCSSLTSITIPSSVTSIGWDAFYGCSSLNKVNITDIAAWCNISFSGSSANPLYYVGNLYLNGELLTELEIPSSVTSIGEYAFYYCKSLASITIPSSVTSIGDSAFSNCDSLTSVAFADNSKLTSIGSDAFEDCSSLTSITIPEGVTSIGWDAFRNCSSLKSITIPNSVTSIGSDAFRDCSSLTSITFAGNSKLTSIGYQAFSGCSSLTSVTIPESVTSIGSDVFDGCSSLTIYAEAISEPEGWAKDTSSNRNNSWNSSNCPVVWDCKNNDVADDGYIYTVDNGIRYALKDGNATVARQPKNIAGSITIPSSITYKGTLYSVTGIADYAFYYCSSLTNITIPSSVTSIDKYAFSSCSSLTSVTIPDSVMNIGSDAFHYCSSLTIYAEIASEPKGWVKNTNNYGGNNSWNSSGCPVVWDCKNNEVADDGCIYVIDNGIRYALKDGKATVVGQPENIVGSITIPSSITYKEISYSVTSIGSHAFYDCDSLTSITIPSSVTSIGSDAFYSCSGLTSITIPSSVTSIGSDAFSSCSSLTSITIPESVTSIGDSAFLYCRSLTIYAEAVSEPIGWEKDDSSTSWNDSWNPDNRPVIWGYKGA